MAVLPDVDLQVTVGVDGFSHQLVVHTTDAADNPELERVEVDIAGHGLDVRQLANGQIEATDAAGEAVFTAGTPLMWDSSGPAAGGDELELQDTREDLGPDDEAVQGRVEAMSIELSGSSLALIPNADLLADPNVEYPLIIDPCGTNYPNRAVYVQQLRDPAGDPAQRRPGIVKTRVVSVEVVGEPML